MANKKDIDFVVLENKRLSVSVNLLRLKCDDSIKLNAMPGQFVEVKVPDKSVLLRRPISICNICNDSELWLLIRNAGNGTKSMTEIDKGAHLSVIFPLGNGFTAHQTTNSPLLVGGGVGVAPLLYLGKKLCELGITPTFLLGARTKEELLLIEEFSKIGNVALSTDDGSFGEPGLITRNGVLEKGFDFIYTCGPLPMMKAIAKFAREKSISCEVSLENVMGCGIGACLCCVEKTVRGNVCVCKDGPVFNINELLW